ncbi:hypothetical protein NADE_009129 [Nannochloris sp. 'desiccata']|nr:hypothetical protein NADE_009129 [Chlorella desiccata (nom. nud.)]
MAEQAPFHPDIAARNYKADVFKQKINTTVFLTSATRNYIPAAAAATAGTAAATASSPSSLLSSQETPFSSQVSDNPTPLPPTHLLNTTTSPTRGGRGGRGSRGGRRRRFISHHNVAKVQDLTSKFNDGRISLENLNHFTEYSTKTLQKILSFLQDTTATELQIPVATHSQLRDILAAAVATRFPPRNDVFTTYKLIKIPVLKPIITSSFSNPISSTFNNTHNIARYSPATISSILSSPCSCSSPLFQPFVHTALGHVCTSDVNILPTSSLRSLAKMGTKYRIGLGGFTVDEAMRAEALQLALLAFNKFSNRYENGLRITGWEAWRNSLQPLIQEQIDADLPLGKPVTIPSNASGLPFSTADFHALRHFQRHFAITSVDKADTSFAFVCKKQYTIWINDDLTNSTVFQPLNTTAALLIPSLDAGISDQARRVLTLGDGSVPNYVCTVKLHKPIPQPRFIVSAGFCYSTPPAKTLCTLLSALDPFTKHLLDDVFTALNNHLSSLPSTSSTPPPSFNWHGHHTILRNAIDMVTRLRSFNAMPTDPEVQFQTGDVSRLYTNLQLIALLQRLVDLYTKLFDKFGVAIKIFDSPTKKPQWLSTYIPGQPRHGGTGYDRYTIFTLDDLKVLLTFIISHNYVHFAQRILKQTQGIAMGGNASVYVANHFLFTYELAFYSQLQQLVATSTNLQILTSLPATEPPNWQETYDSGSVALYLLVFFQWLFRYIDDIITITNIFLQQLLYNNNTFYGISGIYPSELQITLSTLGPTTDFLDITLSSKNGNGSPPLRTTFYNKFSKPEFAALSKTRYVHNSSNLARRIKDNILTGRFHALRRNITDRNSFCQATALVIAQLIRRGYNERRLFRRLFKLLQTYPYLYTHASRSTQQRIMHQVTAFLTENSS